MTLESLSLPAPAQIEVLRKRLAERRGDEALAGAEAELVAFPDDRDLLLIKAQALRLTGRLSDGLVVLDRIETLHPRFSRMHEERGMAYVGLKDADKAIASLLYAVNLNPALPASWNMLMGLYRLTGDLDKAVTASAHVETLKALPKEVVSATALFSDGDIGGAERIIRAFLLRHGDHADAIRLLAKIALAHDVLDDAETLLAGAVALAPDFAPARFDYAETLIRRQKYLQAKVEVERLLALDPKDFAYRTLQASIAVGLGEQGGAIALYQSLIADFPDAWDPWLWLGHALKTVGRTPEAVEAYRAAAANRPDFGDAYWSLANLKTYRFTDEEVEAMRAQESAPGVASLDQIHLSFALAKALEDRGDYEQAFGAYARGNARKRAQSRYSPELFETNTRLQKEVCTQAFFEARAGFGDPSPDPIFILGLPRSGSTLLEQILASHSQVEGTQELADIQRIVLELQGVDPDQNNPLYPAALARLSKEELAALGQRFLRDTAAYRTGKPYFIDKMPNNFRHIGLIHLILPKARIIDARRDPMSCCFSNLKQLFSQGQEFSYSVEDIARYYRTYLDLMQHWDAALPGRVLRVQHEDVVENLEREVRRILDYCGLPFEEACLNFHQNRRSVRTPSSEQVRQPIFRDGLDAWTHFEPWLGDLKTALGDAVTRYRA